MFSILNMFKKLTNYIHMLNIQIFNSVVRENFFIISLFHDTISNISRLG